MPSDRERREKFIKHGNRRLKNAVRSIKLLINIANQRYYKYEESEKNLIFKQLDQAIREVKSCFNSSKNKMRDREESFFK